MPFTWVNVLDSRDHWLCHEGRHRADSQVSFRTWWMSCRFGIFSLGRGDSGLYVFPQLPFTLTGLVLHRLITLFCCIYMKSENYLYLNCFLIMSLYEILAERQNIYSIWSSGSQFSKAHAVLKCVTGQHGSYYLFQIICYEWFLIVLLLLFKPSFNCDYCLITVWKCKQMHKKFLDILT